MSRVILPVMLPLPPDASPQLRDKMYVAYCMDLVRLNPRYYLALGVRKRWYHIGKREHPLTERCHEPTP